MLLVVSGCGTTNNSWLNDQRKSEKYSAMHNDGAKCGIAIAKSGINTFATAQSAAFGKTARTGKSWFSCWYNDAQLQHLIKYCRNKSGEKCFLAFYKDKDTPDDRMYTQPYTSAVEAIQLELEQTVKQQQDQAQRQKLASWSEKCVAFGYALRSEKHKSCMLELYKIDKQPGITTNNGDSGAVRALLEEQKRQRELEGSLELMQRGLEMMQPPKPKLSCTYNPVLRRTTCY